MKNNLTTAAGPTETPSEPTANSTSEHIDAINQCFALFQLNFHNQYYKAFGNTQDLNHAKRLWLEMLGQFEPTVILRAAKQVIQSTDYLPTLHTMTRTCEKISLDALPDPYQAYLEACKAPSPKSGAVWSHPAVYYAGKAADWFFLQSNAENIALPVFKACYEEVCARVRAGEQLAQPQAPALPEEATTPLSKEENAKHLQALREKLSI